MDTILLKRLFLRLSTTLTGFDTLNKALTEEYFDILNQAFPNDLTEAIQFFHCIENEPPADIKTAILKKASDNQAFKAFIKSIISIWYLGKLDKVTALTFNPVRYYEALAWKTVQAHPPGL